MAERRSPTGVMAPEGPDRQISQRGVGMNVIALRTERPSAKSDECSLCNAPHPTSDQPVSPVKQRTDLLPWTVVVTASVVIAAMGAGPERWFGVGAVSGLVAGIACAWVSFQAARRNRGAAHVRELTALSEDADSRVQSVIKQFEWAVSDVVKLKRDAERAQGAADALMDRSRERERYDYLLLATNKTSTMQKELQHAANIGYEYKGQTIFESAFGGKEVVIILERDHERRPDNWEYKLLATTKTSTMQKELAEAAGQGFQLVGLTVAGTSFGGNEVVTILRRTTREHAKAQAEN